MSRNKKNRRTDAQKIADIVEAVANSMPAGIAPTGRETAQRVLARTVALPQQEVSRLMPQAVRESGNMYPGHRLLINAGRNRQTYKLLKRSRSSDITMQGARIAKANTTFERAMFELDVALASTGQRTLQMEGAALSALISGFATRVNEYVTSSAEVSDLDDIGASDWVSEQ